MHAPGPHPADPPMVKPSPLGSVGRGQTSPTSRLPAWRPARCRGCRGSGTAAARPRSRRCERSCARLPCGCMRAYNVCVILRGPRNLRFVASDTLHAAAANIHAAAPANRCIKRCATSIPRAACSHICGLLAYLRAREGLHRLHVQSESSRARALGGGRGAGWRSLRQFYTKKRCRVGHV